MRRESRRIHKAATDSMRDSTAGALHVDYVTIESDRHGDTMIVI